jgi:hypothetical protein
VFTGLIGAAIFAFRGDPPWGRRRRSVGLFGLGTLAWGIFFAGTGAALIIGQPYGESVNEAGEVVGRPDSQLGSTITGITFLVMGLPALRLGIWSQVKGLGSRDERPAADTGGAILGGDPPSGFKAAFQRATIAGSGGPPATGGWDGSRRLRRAAPSTRSRRSSGSRRCASRGRSQTASSSGRSRRSSPSRAERPGNGEGPRRALAVPT